MADTPLYLRPDVVVEPLLDRWYAASHLLAPATAALHLANRSLKIMESYLAAPALHVRSARDPSLRGGPFLDLDPARADEIRTLLDDTRRRRAPLLALAAAFREAWALLAARADGHSLEPLYAELPAALRGYVELVYTLGGAPDLRVIEPLLYRSPYHDASRQSARLVVTSGDHRPFTGSTPRLAEPGAIDLDRPFADRGYDVLAGLRRAPQPFGVVAEALGFAGADADRLRSLLTDIPPPPASPAVVTATRWRYFGHACVLVETPGGQSVLLDPLVPYPDAGGPARFTERDLPERIDHVVLTHHHQDHVVLEMLLALRPRIGTLVVPAGGGKVEDPSLALALRAAGFPRVVELATLETLAAGDVTITALPFLGEHADLDIRTKAAFRVDAAGTRLLFAADSNNVEPRLYELLRELTGPVDVLFIGMECEGAPLSWVYGPVLPRPLERSKDQSRRLNGSDFPRALRLVRSLECRQVFVYAMGLEPWTTFISSLHDDEDTAPLRASRALVAACEDLGIPAERLYGRAEGTAPEAF